MIIREKFYLFWKENKVIWELDKTKKKDEIEHFDDDYYYDFDDEIEEKDEKKEEKEDNENEKDKNSELM